jgi:glycosyltransferase involved in cell wall biosynthesis
MTLLEAKSWGLPLVAFDIMTGPSDIIDHEKNGYLIQPFDLDAMADGIGKLMDDELARRVMSDRAHEGMEKFDCKNILQSWEGILKEE